MNDSSSAQISKPRDRAQGSGGRLVRRTFVFTLVLASGGLLTGGAVELFFRYRESVENIWVLQKEMAQGAAFKIDQFMQDIEKSMRASTQTKEIISGGLTDSFKFQLAKLLKVAPAITATAVLDASGVERLKVSRVEMIRPEDLDDRATDVAFLQARNGPSYFGSVYFVDGSEPYVQIAVPIKRFADEVVGVLTAEVNLKYIWDVISQIRAGEAGYAYVVSIEGDLVAHPNISLVLRRPSFRDLDQVRSALAGADGPIAPQLNYAGQRVFAAYAAIPKLEWFVLVERPVAEAYGPLYSSLLRTGVLLLIGLSIAVLASLIIGFRVVRPLRVLREGAAKIGAGDLDHRIEVRTGDELERLADEFNQMTTQLRDSYLNIEHMSHLKRYFSPHLADLIISSGEEGITESHRQEITVVFCDLRNFTEFSSIAEPEEAMRVLRQFYKGHFAGDGLMAFFNDPLPCPDPAARAVRMAMAMQQDVEMLVEQWQRRGIKLGLGIGISSGYATLGNIGSEEQFHYTAIGTVVNLASRFCDEAESGQILIAEAVYADVQEFVDVKFIGEISLKGFPKPISVLEVAGTKNEPFNSGT
jgi:class 3 adenylate cyclase/HAMP domain-containing protein